MDRKPSAVHIVCLLTQQIEKLRVDHADQEVERAVRVTHDQEQRRLPVSDSIQLQLIVSCDLPKLPDIKGSKPCTAADQN